MVLSREIAEFQNNYSGLRPQPILLLFLDYIKNN